MCDILRTQSETTTNVPGSSASCWANLTPVTQAGYEAGFPIVLCLDDSVADNVDGTFLIHGQGLGATLGDASSTTDADRGDPVSILVSESAVALQAAAAGDRVVGLYLADTAASGTSNIELFWTGGAVCGGCTF